MNTIGMVIVLCGFCAYVFLKEMIVGIKTNDTLYAFEMLVIAIFATAGFFYGIYVIKLLDCFSNILLVSIAAIVCLCFLYNRLYHFLHGPD